MIFLGRMDAKIDHIMAEQKAQAKKQDGLETKVQGLDHRVGKLEAGEEDRGDLPTRINEIENYQQRERGRRNVLITVVGVGGTVLGAFVKTLIQKGGTVLGG